MALQLFTEEYLTRRLVDLEGAQRRDAGSLPLPVCRVCYATFDTKGCLCRNSRPEWVAAALVVAEIRLKLDEISVAHKQAAKETTFPDEKVVV